MAVLTCPMISSMVLSGTCFCRFGAEGMTQIEQAAINIGEPTPRKAAWQHACPFQNISQDMAGGCG